MSYPLITLAQFKWAGPVMTSLAQLDQVNLGDGNRDWANHKWPRPTGPVPLQGSGLARLAQLQSASVNRTLGRYYRMDITCIMLMLSIN